MRLLGLTIAFLVTAGAAHAGDISSVSVRPHGTTVDDPNRGGWFAFEVAPGGSVAGEAAITNPAAIAQDVRLDVRDMVFSSDGTGALREGDDEDVGAWGAFERPEVRIPPLQTVVVGFTLQVPADAEPGDHIGAVVATTANVQDGVEVRRSIATRLYVTVPGEAVRSMVIESVDVTVDSRWWPGTAVTVVRLHNDGRIRLRPQVRVGDREAAGSAVLLSRSSEDYFATVDVNWWGGLLRLPVTATADGGLARVATTTRLVVPWGLLAVLALAGVGAALGAWWWRQRLSATAQLREDIQRLERLVVEQRAAPAAGPKPAPRRTPPRPKHKTAMRAAQKVAPPARRTR